MLDTDNYKKSSTDDDSNTINVGVLFSHSGLMSVTEKAHLQGTLLAISEINENGGIGGKLITPIIENPESSPELYASLAKKILLSKDDVPVIFGCCSSSSRKAVIPVVEKFGCLLFYPSFYEGFEYCPCVYYTGATPNQTAIPLIKYLLNEYGKKFYLIGSDYIYPHEINRIIKEFLDESGGRVLGEEYIKLGADPSEYKNIIANIKATNPDVVFSTVVGLDAVNFYNAYSKSGIDINKHPVASLTASEGELALVDDGAKSGYITSSVYFNSIETQSNKSFLERFEKKYGSKVLPNVYSVTAYSQVYLFAKAMEMADSDDIIKISEALSFFSLDTPLGNVAIDHASNHLSFCPKIGLSDSSGKFKVIWEAPDSVRPDPYLVAYNRELLYKSEDKKI